MMILISAKTPKGFWRCGMFHPPEQTEYSDDHFSAGQLAVLQAESMLSVVIVPDKPEEPKPKTAK